MSETNLPTNYPFGREILRCEVGSTAHGTSLPGTDDLDLLGIVVPKAEYLFGLTPFDCFIYRDAAVREGKADARSQPGDVDLTLYSLQKFARLAQKGNPSILMAFFAPVKHIDPLGARLREAAPLFVSKEAGFRFMGYLKAQRERMLGQRGQLKVKRPELVEKYGFDTKFAYHMLRLGIQGIEFMKHGRIHVPMQPWVSDLLVAVREGQYDKDKIVQWANELETELLTAIEESGHPDKAPSGPINTLLQEIHEQVLAEAVQIA